MPAISSTYNLLLEKNMILVCKKNLVVLTFLVFGVMSHFALAQTPAKPDPASLKKWRDARFGMFIHWGPVSLTGHEIGWSRGKQTPTEEYDQLYKKFNPTKFNADEWVRLAKTAGMKYLVITSKHRDG